MKSFDWEENKNNELRSSRNITFEDVLFFIERGEIIDILENPNQEKYPGQRFFILNINEYIYYVPFVEDDDKIFLKTIIPSRKYKKIFRRKAMNTNYNDDELNIVEAIETRIYKSVDNLENEKKRYSEYAANAIRKDKRVNIRISDRDLKSIQRKAIEEGIPYQTLISSLLHKYLNGRLVDIQSVR